MWCTSCKTSSKAGLTWHMRHSTGLVDDQHVTPSGGYFNVQPLLDGASARSRCTQALSELGQGGWRNRQLEHGGGSWMVSCGLAWMRSARDDSPLVRIWHPVAWFVHVVCRRGRSFPPKWHQRVRCSWRCLGGSGNGMLFWRRLIGATAFAAARLAAFIQVYCQHIRTAAPLRQREARLAAGGIEQCWSC